MSFCPEPVARSTARSAAPEGTLKGHTLLVCATEALDLPGALHFDERVRPLLANCSCLVVDLRGAEFIDSSGVRMLLSLAEELEAAGKELRLVIEPGSRVERTLRLLRLLSRFEAYPTPGDARQGECFRPS